MRPPTTFFATTPIVFRIRHESVGVPLHWEVTIGAISARLPIRSQISSPFLLFAHFLPMLFFPLLLVLLALAGRSTANSGDMIISYCSTMTAVQGNGTISVQVDVDTTTMTYSLTAKFSGLDLPTDANYAPKGTPIGVTNGTVVMTDVSDDTNTAYFEYLKQGAVFPGFAMNFLDVFIGTKYVVCMAPTSFVAKTAMAKKKMERLRKAAQRERMA